MKLELKHIPDICLIVGTDAAGKDHVADVLHQMILEAGGSAQKRKRFFNGEVTVASSSTDKPDYELGLERLFLVLFPFFGFLMPLALQLLLKRDLAKFRQPESKLIIVGHNCLRGLAFYWGHRYRTTEQISVSPRLTRALGRMRATPGLHTVVLDVEDAIRKQRIEQRERLGEADNFDRYMAADSVRSERIEHFLVWTATSFLNGQLIENNDLPDAELRRLLTEAFIPESETQGDKAKC